MIELNNVIQAGIVGVIVVAFGLLAYWWLSS